MGQYPSRTGVSEDLEEHEQAGNPHGDSASLTDTTSTSEVQTQALAYRLLGGI